MNHDNISLERPDPPPFTGLCTASVAQCPVMDITHCTSSGPPRSTHPAQKIPIRMQFSRRHLHVQLHPSRPYREAVSRLVVGGSSSSRMTHDHPPRSLPQHAIDLENSLIIPGSGGLSGRRGEDAVELLGDRFRIPSHGFYHWQYPRSYVGHGVMAEATGSVHSVQVHRCDLEYRCDVSQRTNEYTVPGTARMLRSGTMRMGNRNDLSKSSLQR